MAEHAFDAAITLEPLGEGRFAGATSAAYANMVGPFGGVTAAAALNAVLQHPALLGEPVALTVNYAAALADGPFEVTARAARTNRSTQHWVVEIVQAGETVLTATAMTATRRETWSVDELPAPEMPTPDAVGKPNMAALVEWVKRYDIRITEGAIPTAWDGSGETSRTTLWMRDEPARALDFCSLAAMADVFYPRVWLRRATRVPAGTVSMTVYFHAGGAQLAAVGAGWLKGQAQAQAFRNGFFDQAAQVWSEAGQLLATTHQVVYFKE
ncbi:MAG: thioesterase family protein [Hydrogenophaga sp.]|uniref:acyl-CoA thioesterase n=1 Tax=Hydrogenophaga sp. TaxID=1904254 RepID=UPI002730E4B8|nr:thioesterase family protein [Hydrogenophaga sp.]MDP2074137.1 thioesterase family protein [Hydrogenophaga sp.]MDP3109841.1 thioesterase family protein [Hydrogenophaga sp.]MDP3205921.1 thioesterase family protein [Hydrogenophaga sp.]